MSKTNKIKKGKTNVKRKKEPEIARLKKCKTNEGREAWKWWKEKHLEDGIKWKTLRHNGPVFAPPYKRLPKYVKFYYEGKPMKLSAKTEEVAGFYGRMLDQEYTSKGQFNRNFFKDWRTVMTPREKEIIKNLRKCNFKDFDVYYKQKSKEKKTMTKKEKLITYNFYLISRELKKENEKLTKKYGYCIIDGHKEKVGNFKIEPPGLFRGRGTHPKMGMLKRRITPKDVIINIGKKTKIPRPPSSHEWKEVRHDNTVSWLARWSENILGSTKYIMLNPSSKLKGQKDFRKYETARKLKVHVNRIRKEYMQDLKSKDIQVLQRAVALYFIDKLALRAGNEKMKALLTQWAAAPCEWSTSLCMKKDGKKYVVSFDFPGKDAIRYVNSVAVDRRVFNRLKLFIGNKQPGNELFDRLNTSFLNKYLNDLMEGLTTKVFRTYNASKNSTRAAGYSYQRNDKKKKKRLMQLVQQLKNLKLQATDKEENKQIALGTSKLNYLDPRIIVAWCTKYNVPIEKIYNKSQRDKFRWAIEITGPNYMF
ncbi:DNA topoisomerase 1 [Caerostris extrusa]|uniref:DNA topoisomerase 1 n=1 Tax=Caerostris extrusa TaxID=172846 RepID=A0AAV4N7E1_CAEEX|nr:DNA topoisomerase 1 [Caerostris extrusa]